MTGLLGWTLIVLTLGSFSLVALWPIFKLIRRVRGELAGGLWSYAAASAGLSLMLWISTPHIIHSLFGRTVH